jgi:hypothetical protein
VTVIKRINEKEHIRKVGKDRMQRAFDLAHFEIKQDSCLVGLEKIRKEMAHAAALEATGFERKRPWASSKDCGRPEQRMMDICAEVMPKAVAAAREGLRMQQRPAHEPTDTQPRSGSNARDISTWRSDDLTNVCPGPSTTELN